MVYIVAPTLPTEQQEKLADWLAVIRECSPQQHFQIWRTLRQVRHVPAHHHLYHVNRRFVTLDDRSARAVHLLG